jgi:hypothetical protein
MPSNRFTVYDVMEARGVFRLNPANNGAQDATGAVIYNGPVQYPKMMYHPKGEERVISEGEVINTPLGPKVIGMQKELISKVVQDAAEEAEATKLGWHLHPANAIAASGKTPPPVGSARTIDEINRQIEQLRAQKTLLELQAKKA